MPGPVVRQEGRPRILTGAEEDTVRVLRGLLWQRGDMQPAQRDVCTLGAVVIGERIGTGSRGDVHLDDNQLWLGVGHERLHMLGLERRGVALVHIAGERYHAERRGPR